MIKAVIFDMDGVIIDSEMGYLELLYGFIKTKNPKAKIEQLYSTVGKTAKDTWSIVEKVTDNGQSWEEIRAEYKALNTYAGIDYTKIFRREIIEILNKLRAKGYKLAVASSTSLPLVERILTVNEIIGYFDVIVSGNMFKRSKPDPEIYHYTAKTLGVKEEECFVLEDSTVGITAAHSAGMTVAALIDDRFGFDRSLADLEVESLEGIMTYLV